jgi:hypothetical protein
MVQVYVNLPGLMRFISHKKVLIDYVGYGKYSEEHGLEKPTKRKLREIFRTYASNAYVRISGKFKDSAIYFENSYTDDEGRICWLIHADPILAKQLENLLVSR